MNFLFFIKFLFSIGLWVIWSSLVALVVKNLPAVWETQVRSLSLEEPPEEGNGNPLQYSCLENPMDKGAWQAIVHGVTKESDTTE